MVSPAPLAEVVSLGLPGGAPVPTTPAKLRLTDNSGRYPPLGYRYRTLEDPATHYVQQRSPPAPTSSGRVSRVPSGPREVDLASHFLPEARWTWRRIFRPG